MPLSDFAVGDLVKFINGGPRLIILRIMDDLITGEGGVGPIAHCAWFNTTDCSYDYQQVFLPIAQLVKSTVD